MIKILVDSPQEVIFVEDSGGYYGDKAILWDERIDGDMPPITIGKMARVGNSLIEQPDYLPEHALYMLSKARESKKAELLLSYDAAVHADIVHNTKTYPCDENKLNIISRVSALNTVPVGMYVRDKDGVAVNMTLAEVRALGAAVAARWLAEDQNLYTKLAAVDAATTAAEVNAIVY